MRCLLMRLRMRLLRSARFGRVAGWAMTGGEHADETPVSREESRFGTALLAFAANVAMFAPESSLAKE